MTRSTNARVAGVTFLAYIALGIGSMIWLIVKGVRAPQGRAA